MSHGLYSIVSKKTIDGTNLTIVKVCMYIYPALIRINNIQIIGDIPSSKPTDPYRLFALAKTPDSGVRFDGESAERHRQ